MPSTRREVVAALGAGTALSGCLTAESPDGDLGTVGGEWAMDGRDAGHTRRVDGQPSDPEQVWRRELDGVRATGTPSLADGRLYVPADAASDDSRYRHRLHSLDAATGETRWQAPLRVDLNGAPAVSPDRITVTGTRSVETGRIVCFHPRYGEEEWLYDADARLTAAPTVAEGVVYVGDHDGRVHALGAVKGNVRWSRRVDEGVRRFANAAAVADGTVYLGSRSGTTGVVALDAKNGGEEWHASTGSVTGGPVVHDGLVVVESHGLVTAFDTDGDERWSFNVPGDRFGPMAADDDHVYVPRRDALVAIDRRGERSWAYGPPDGEIGTPTVAGDSVLVRAEDRLVSLSAEDSDESGG